VFVAVTQNGYVKRLSRRRSPLVRMGRDAIQYLAASNTMHKLLFCTNKGRCFTTIVHQIPDSQSAGVPIANLLRMEADEVLICIVDVPDFGNGGFLTMCTAEGRIKRTAVEEFSAVRSGGLSAIKLNEGDELRWGKLTNGKQQLILVTAKGQALRFREDEVRDMGRGAAGVYAIKLASGDWLIGMDVVEAGGSLLVVSEKGYAKRTRLANYPTQSRYSKGVSTFAARSLTQTGHLVAARVVGENDTIAILRSRGTAVQSRGSDIPLRGRATRGTVLVELGAKDTVLGIVRLVVESKTARRANGTSSRRQKKASGSRRRSTQSRKSKGSQSSKASTTGTSRSKKTKKA
jgi:DNA gyrase subunit A